MGKSARPVEAVIFDFGGVISVSFSRDLARFEADLGYPPGALLALLFGEGTLAGNPRGGDPTDGAAGADTSAVTHDWHRLEVGELTLHDYLLDVIDRAPEVLGEPIGMDAYARFVAEMPIGVHWPVVHAVRDLQARGYTLALLTNNVREFGDTWRDTFPVDELFPVVVDSSAVGLRKPDPRIYELTCARIGLAPEVCVFIDDNLDNVEAARALGMEAIRFGDDPWAVLAELEAILTRRPRT
ncbi:MAG: HAD-superfamily hydrolase, subfamily variant 3 [Actinomycetia bacterium]|nr:HAD-superfamily hydrolase, subfamily variant 3 [Actinomycetes bacterium]